MRCARTCTVRCEFPWRQVDPYARAAKLLAIKSPIVVFVNNHFASYAHDTVRELLVALQEETSPF